MKKVLVIVSFLAFSYAGTSMAQTADKTKETPKTEASTTKSCSDKKHADMKCCDKNSKTSEKKSSCCSMKSHAEANTETPKEEIKKN